MVRFKRCALGPLSVSFSKVMAPCSSKVATLQAPDFAYGGSGTPHDWLVAATWLVSEPDSDIQKLSSPSRYIATPDKGSVVGTVVTSSSVKERKSKSIVPTSATMKIIRSGGAKAECDCHRMTPRPWTGGVHMPGSGGRDGKTKTFSRHVP